MKYSIFFQWMLKAVLLLAVVWFLVAFLNKNVFLTERKSRTYGNNLSDGLGDSAFGELGSPVILPNNLSEENKQAISDGWKKNAFNQYVSDLISIRRKLPDLRDEWCKVPGRNLEDLPQTSVVICFHNEAWSVLLRTVHSVLDRSPDHLIKEIILVDDFSDMPHLMQQLDDYMSSLPKVRIIRATRREGLIRARLLGAQYVTAPVLTYLDSHCECAEGWLEPLLDRIARNKTTVVCPVIDIIDHKTFEYSYASLSSIGIGGFDWNLEFTWHSVSLKERARHQHPAEPLWSPAMAGGLFAIDKAFFERLGTYDSGYEIWGGENLELSFKTWMCGGTLEIVPCSHVGHIFRNRSPYATPSDAIAAMRNSFRLAEVWLDDYAKYYHERYIDYNVDFGDITGRRELRDRLGCKSFEWYLKNIYPELFIPGESIAHGQFRNIINKRSYCLDSETIGVPAKHDGRLPTVNIRRCHAHWMNQFWMYSKNGEIRRDDFCLDYPGAQVFLNYCHGGEGNQLWLYNYRTKLLENANNECMATSRNKDKVIMEKCNASEARQMWNLENYSPERFAERSPALHKKIPVVNEQYKLDLRNWYR